MFFLCKEEFICNHEIVTILFCECSNKCGDIKISFICHCLKWCEADF